MDAHDLRSHPAALPAIFANFPGNRKSGRRAGQFFSNDYAESPWLTIAERR
jgi:hypothetical protein